MSKNSIIVKTLTGTLLELSYPKRISKFKIQFEFVRDISNKHFKNVFNGISHGTVENVFEESVNAEALNNKYINLNNLVLITGKNYKVKMVPIVEYNPETLKYDFNIIFTTLNKETGNYDKVIKQIQLPLSNTDLEIINNVFIDTSTKMKAYAQTPEKIQVSFYIPSEDTLSEYNVDNIGECILPFFKFSTIEDKKWSVKQSLSKSYLERIFNLLLSKKYKFNNISKSTLEDWTKDSNYTVNIEEIIREARTTKNNIVSFPLHSILIEKTTV